MIEFKEIKIDQTLTGRVVDSPVEDIQAGWCCGASCENGMLCGLGCGTGVGGWCGLGCVK